MTIMKPATGRHLTQAESARARKPMVRIQAQDPTKMPAARRVFFSAQPQPA